MLIVVLTQIPYLIWRHPILPLNYASKLKRQNHFHYHKKCLRKAKSIVRFRLHENHKHVFMNHHQIVMIPRVREEVSVSRTTGGTRYKYMHLKSV